MRRLNLVPEDVLARRRRGALLRRGAWQLVALAAALGAALGAVHRWQEGQRAALAALERRALRVAAASTALDSLGTVADGRAARLGALEALAGRRPVTGLVTLLASELPAGVRLESLVIESAAALRAGVTPGQSGYFGSGAGAATQIVLRGTARNADDVASLLRNLEATARFRLVQLARLDRPAAGESTLLGFEVRCEV